MDKMRFGVIAGNFNAPAKLVAFAKTAEDCGFDHFLLSDHYWVEDAPDMLDSWAMIARISGVTSTLRLGTCVTPLPFRPPLQFAKIVTTLDNATEGRIIVGAGAGWEKSEFEMFSHWYPNKARYVQFQEALELLVKSWTEASVNFSGRYYKVSNAIVEPKPVQKPHPPLLFGGWSKGIVRLAGQKGQGWTPTGPRSGEAVKTPADYRRFAELIRKEQVKHHRGEAQFSFGCRFGPFENPKDHLKEIEEFSAVGLNCYQLGVNVKKHSENTLRRFADAVMATL